MSRRQSRVSIDVRQNDTLLEFETFKKKFLLANKHITKLNSTLSVRIEELNAQISTLYAENLRLRASEIALASQLKQERQKSRKIIADAEAATHSLIKHLGHIRKSFNVHTSSPETQPEAQPRAKRPVVNPDASPPYTRLARAPTVPGITEDDEDHASSPESPDADAEEDTSPPSPTPAKKRRARPRVSDPSRLPVPARAAEPPPPLPALPVVNFDEELGRVGKRKPTRRQSGLLTSVSITTVTPGGISTELVPPRPPSPAFGSPLRRSVGLEEQAEEAAAARGDLEEQEVETILQAVKRERKERKRERERDKDRDSGTESIRVRDREERRRAREQDEPAAAQGGKSKLKDVTNSHSPPDTVSDRERQHTPDAGDAPVASGSAPVGPSGHSTRTFLSTPAPKSGMAAQPNYLPTPRSSSPLPAGAASEPEAGGRERRVRKSINYAEPKLNTKMRKPDSAASMSKRASTSSDRASPEFVPPPAPTDTQPVMEVKRKKSRAYVEIEDGEESEGTQADAEYGGRVSGWANVDARRRSVTSSAGARRFEDDVRRHSMAV